MSTTNPTQIESEWDSLQRKFGNLPKLPQEPTENEITDRIVNTVEQIDTLGNKTLEQLNELEDEVDEDLLQVYRNKRIEELKQKALKNRFGEVIHIAKDEFIQEVTNASAVDPLGTEPQRKDDESSDESDTNAKLVQKKKSGTWVIVHMYQDGVESCRLLGSAFKEAAKKYPYIKFIEAKSTDVIEGFPNHKLPMVLLYYGGGCQKQVGGTNEWGGDKIALQSVEEALARFNVISRDDVSYKKSHTHKRSNKKYIGYNSDASSSSSSSNSDTERRRTREKGYASLKLDDMLSRNY